MSTEHQDESGGVPHAVVRGGVKVTSAVIAGFGLPGRAAANALVARNVPFTVIEANEEVVNRCARAGLHIIVGDCRDAGVLEKAGIGTADFLAICVPIDEVVLATIPLARRMNPGVHILARCAMTSNGMKAKALGADEIVVAEQVVANEFSRVLTAPVDP